MKRRHFLAMLGIAPLAFNPHRVYFDMGRKLFIPETYSQIFYRPIPPNPNLTPLITLSTKISVSRVEMVPAGELWPAGPFPSLLIPPEFIESERRIDNVARAYVKFLHE